MIKSTNKTKLLGILGDPIGHTLSPLMHSFMAEKMNIDMAYLAFNVGESDFKDAILGLKAIGGQGFNITAPHKIRVMDYLHEVDEEAKIMNSVNTIVNKGGKWYGYNTDGDGYIKSLLLDGVEIRNKDILVMGAGGSARSLCYKLAKQGVRSITITSRSIEKIHTIGNVVEKYTEAKFLDTFDKTKNYDIIINTTPLGMHPYENENSCSFMEIISDKTVCSDAIYNPKKTVFLKEAEKKNAKIHNGLGMLICQGILAFEKFLDVKTDDKKMYDELLALFSQYRI